MLPDLVQHMSRANALWGVLRIHGEELKLDVAPSTVGKYLRRNRRPRSQNWRPFLKNHMKQMASIDSFPVLTVWFLVLFVFVVLSHDRRRVVHSNFQNVFPPMCSLLAEAQLHSEFPANASSP